MSIYEFDEEREMKLIREDERDIGREEGKEIGRKEGKDKINDLYKRLKADGCMEDIMKAIDDKDYQEQLMREYGI